jgi:hypothetical protein
MSRAHSSLDLDKPFALFDATFSHNAAKGQTDPASVSAPSKSSSTPSKSSSTSKPSSTPSKSASSGSRPGGPAPPAARDDSKPSMPMIVRSLCGSSHAAGDNAAFEHLPHAGSDARLTAPVRGCVDPFGNFVFADQGNSVVRRVTPGGHATVIGGRAQRPARVDGPNGDARFYCTMVPLMQAYNTHS